jgi:hypothetical protein
MVHALSTGLVAVASSVTILRILMMTGQSATPALAYRRYKANAMHAKVWYNHPIKAGSE